MKNPWENIKQPSKDVSALRVDPDHPLDLYWAKDYLGKYLFVYEYPADSDVVIKNPPELTGIDTVTMQPNGDTSRLVLILLEKSDWELFFSLCSDLIRATVNVKIPKAASATIFLRLKRWQDFLRKKKPGILPEERIKGLIGELVFLQKYLIPRYGLSDSVKFWIGPEGSPQDFTLNEYAVEVKCQIGGSVPTIKISSADQLFTQLSKLYLFVVTLGKTSENNPEGINLPNIINKISDILEAGNEPASNRFQDLLLNVGYIYSDKYYEFNYILSDIHVYEVEEEFPKIIPNSIMKGISRVTYYIAINDCKPFEIDIKKWEVING
jgi:hypothetical protein